MTPDEVDAWQARIRALRAELAEHLPAARVAPYDGAPARSSEHFPRWLRERARFREMTAPVLNPPVPTASEMAKVLPLRRPSS